MIEINSNGYKKRRSQRYNRHCIPRMIYREIMKYYEEGFKMFSGHQKAISVVLDVHKNIKLFMFDGK